MRSKKLLLCMGAGLIVLVSCTGIALWLPSSDSLRKEFDRIRAGMTLPQVEAILGPQGNYGTRPGRGVQRKYTIVTWGDYSDSKGNKFCYWRYDSLQIEIVLGPDGRVLKAEYDRITSDDEGPFDDILWRLRQLWKWVSR